MANKFRGEVEVELGGKKLLLRPDFTGLVEAEELSGKGLNEMAGDFARGKMGIKTAAALVYGGLVGAGNGDYTFKQIGEMIQKHGLQRFTVELGRILFAAMNIESKDEKKEDQGGKQDPAAEPGAPAASAE